MPEHLGRIGTDNLPVFLSTVSYGRMLYVTISSNRGFDEVKTALSASYNSGAAGGSAEMSEGSKKTLNEATITVSGIGIQDSSARDLIRTGKIQEFFASKTNIRSVRPISYIFYSLRDLSIAGLTDTTTYNITVCHPRSDLRPSVDIDKRATALETDFSIYRQFVLAAASNAHDPPTRSARTSTYQLAHSNIVGNLDWFKTNAKTIIHDDMAWLLDWLPHLLPVVEDHVKTWQRGYDTNPSDPGTRAVYGNALYLSASQRIMINFAVNELSKV